MEMKIIVICKLIINNAKTKLKADFSKFRNVQSSAVGILNHTRALNSCRFNWLNMVLTR